MAGGIFKARVGFEAKIGIIAETFKAKVGFEAKIGIIAKAKVEVDKFLTASRGTNNNIEGLDINNSAAGLIALYLTTLPGLVSLNRKIIVIAIRFSYFFISF